jgi:phenylpropionate dioxygenase-like ring-hydroxylating dioxygenase large terminal subunit
MERSPNSGDGLLESCPPRVAPAANRLLAYPHSWYLFGPAAEMRINPLSKQIFGRELVAFRTSGEQLAILDARCAHQGADLGRGDVIGDRIRCPYHHWEYGPDGRCLHVPSQPEIPAFAQQASYPVAERHGYVYVFNGRKPLFELPFFADCRPEDYSAGQVFRFIAQCTWYMFAANLFDEQHWLTQHQRRLVAPPQVDTPHPLARQIRFEAEVVGSSPFDRLLRCAAGTRVQTSITCWGGNFFFATGEFHRAKSYVHVITTPLDAGRLQVDVIVFVRRWRNRALGTIAEPIALWLRRLFTHGFMRGEFEDLAGIRYNPQSLIGSDRQLADFFRWAAELPRDITTGARAAVSSPETQPIDEATWHVGSPKSGNL